jgi:hypothetical protein
MSYQPLGENDCEIQAGLAKRFKAGVDDFKENYRKLCEKFAGVDWQRCNFQNLFRHIHDQIVPIWVEAGHEKKIVEALCSGAESCLVTGAPFKFYRRSPEKLAKAALMLSTVEKASLERWEQAFVKIAKDKQIAKEEGKLRLGLTNGIRQSLHDLPLKDKNEDPIAYRVRVLYTLKAFLTADVSRSDLLCGEDDTAIALDNILGIVLKTLERREKKAG